MRHSKTSQVFIILAARIAPCICVLSSAGLAAPAMAAPPDRDRPEVLSSMIVTASPLDTELAVPVIEINRDDILKRGAATLGELLGNKPGIAQSSFAGGASRPIIRGLDNFRVQLLENGLGSDGVSAVSEDHAVPIDPLSARKVEVVRGPATLRYGSKAIGGVVNVINTRIPTKKPEDGIEGEVSGSYDTAARGRQGAALVEAASGNLVWHADAYARKTEDYRIPGSVSHQAETWSRSQGVAGGVSMLFEGGHVGASISHFDADYGIPVPEDPADPTFIDMQQTRIQLSGEFNAPDSWARRLRLSGGYNRYNHGEVAAASGALGSVFDDKLLEARAELQHADIGPFSGVIGIHAIRHDLSAAGEGGELLAPAETRTLAAFLFEEVPLAQSLSLQLGMRVEKQRIEGAALNETSLAVHEANRSFTPLSGSAALVWTLGGGWVGGLTAQAVQRAPDALELFSKGPHEATGTFELGNPALGKETAFSTELSLRREGEGYQLEASVYRTSFSSYVLKQRTGLFCDDEFTSCGTGSELEQVRYIQRDATFKGIELSGSADVLQLAQGVIGVDAQFDMVRATLDSGGNVPRIPPMRIGAGLFYEGDAVGARAGFLHAFSQNDIGAFETSTSGYTLLNANLTYRLALPDRERGTLEISIAGENLLNEEIRNHVSFKKNGMLLPGRTIRLTMTARY